MSKRSKIEGEILEEYLKSHRNISDRQLSRIKKAIKDIDIRTYEGLAEFDKKSGVTNKRKEYINIMLKNYRKKFGESTQDYTERVYSEKDRLLKDYGINTSSRRTRHLTFKGFSKGLDFGKIKVKDKAKVERKMKKMKDKISKSPIESISSFVDKLKPSKSKIHLTTPKGFFNKLKDWKENNPTKFKKYRIRAIIATLLISFSIGGVKIHNNIKNDSNLSTSSYIEIDETADDDSLEHEFLEEDVDGSEIELDTNEEDLEIGDSTEDFIETEISDDTEENEIENIEEEENEIENAENETTTNYVSSTSAIHSLITNSNIGFNTEFQMQYGLYYETPEETGKFGRYINFEGADLKLTYIDAIYEDGKIVSYDASSGLSIADIIKENEGATLSYHVETTDGRILGWNSSTSNNIEASLLLGHINQLQSYISSENMEFLSSLDLRNLSEISEDNVQKILEIIKTAENTQEQSLNNSYDEQTR